MHATTARSRATAAMRLVSDAAYAQPPDRDSAGRPGSSAPSLRGAPSGDVDVTLNRRTTPADARDQVVVAARAPAGPT